jgi:hypothetical protein
LNCPTQIIGLTKFVQDYIFYRCQRLNTNQSKEQVRAQKKEAKREPKAALVWRTGQSGVPPDSVRCTRVLQLELFTFGFPRRSSAIIHRTVRCATGQCPVHHRTVRCTSGATTMCGQRSTLQSEQWNSDVRAASQRGTGLSGATRGQSLPRSTCSKP